MLQREQHLAALRIDDVLEAVLVLPVLLADQPALHQAFVGAGEIGDVDLDVAGCRSRESGPRSRAEDQRLVVPDGDECGRRAVLLPDRRAGADDLVVEARYAGGAADRDVRADIGHAQAHPSETLVGLVQPDPVAPRAGRVDMVVRRGVVELGILELIAHLP